MSNQHLLLCLALILSGLLWQACLHCISLRRYKLWQYYPWLCWLKIAWDSITQRQCMLHCTPLARCCSSDNTASNQWCQWLQTHVLILLFRFPQSRKAGNWFQLCDQSRQLLPEVWLRKGIKEFRSGKGDLCKLPYSCWQHTSCLTCTTCVPAEVPQFWSNCNLQGVHGKQEMQVQTNPVGCLARTTGSNALASADQNPRVCKHSTMCKQLERNRRV